MSRFLRLAMITLGIALLLCLPIVVRDAETVCAQRPRTSRENVEVLIGGPAAGNERPAEAGGRCCFDLLGDANRDFMINWKDAHIIASAYDTSHGEDGYDWRADINCDGDVNYLDLILVDLMICAAREDALLSGRETGNA